MSALNVAAFVERSEVNGPGVRAVVWVQGCPRIPICPGCYNPDFLDTTRMAERVPVTEMALRIRAIGGLDGVTFSGGEPFFQATALAELAGSLPGLTVAVFTGLTLEEIRAADRPDWNALLAATDLLIDGPYERKRPSSLPLRSSANQRLQVFGDRIRSQDLDGSNDAVEVLVDDAGGVSATGLVDGELLRRLRAT